MNVEEAINFTALEAFMRNDFKKELEKNRIAEVILLQVLSSIAENMVFEDVTNNPELFHYGDIKSTDKDGNVYYWDCKNDGVIHKTGRVFCETHKYFFRDMKRSAGFMENGKYDYLCVVDRVDGRIYILDFSVLLRIHKNYKEVKSIQSDAYCYGTVIPLNECRKQQALLYTIKYAKEGSAYFATDVICEQKGETINF